MSRSVRLDDRDGARIGRRFRAAGVGVQRLVCAGRARDPDAAVDGVRDCGADLRPRDRPDRAAALPATRARAHAGRPAAEDVPRPGRALARGADRDRSRARDRVSRLRARLDPNRLHGPEFLRALPPALRQPSPARPVRPRSCRRRVSDLPAQSVGFRRGLALEVRNRFQHRPPGGGCFAVASSADHPVPFGAAAAPRRHLQRHGGRTGAGRNRVGGVVLHSRPAVLRTPERRLRAPVARPDTSVLRGRCSPRRGPAAFVRIRGGDGIHRRSHGTGSSSGRARARSDCSSAGGPRSSLPAGR